MIKLEFTEAEKQSLHYDRYHPPPPRGQRKREALWWKSQGVAPRAIRRLTGSSSTPLTSSLRVYQEGGLEALKTVQVYRPQREVRVHQGTLDADFQPHPPASAKQAMATIEALTGGRRRPDRVRVFLKHLGMKGRKVGMIPAKADVEAQETFKTTALEPRLEPAKAGPRAGFFRDAAPFVLGPFLGMLWCFARVFIRAPAGRRRFTVLGALNALPPEVITMANDTYLKAGTGCEFLRQLAALHLGVPITLILDNARYQKGERVTALAASLQIELRYLPASSPTLNLIERVGKFVKKTGLYSTDYANLQDFKPAISDCWAHPHTTYQKELDSLLTRKCQTFKESQVMAA